MPKKEHKESGTRLYYFIRNTLESIVVDFEAISVSFLLSFEEKRKHLHAIYKLLRLQNLLAKMSY